MKTTELQSIQQALDTLALALAYENHTWKQVERDSYNKATSILRKSSKEVSSSEFAGMQAVGEALSGNPKALEAVEQLVGEIGRLSKAGVPVCVGRELIQILAAEGQWVSMDGQGLIAADGLFRKDPYIELEQAWQEAAVLRQDNEHHVNGCYAAEKARNEALDELDENGLVLQKLQNERNAALAEVERLREDLRLAAGEMLVPIPEPGTVAARMLSANVLMRHERDALRRKVAVVKGLLEALRVASCLGAYTDHYVRQEANAAIDAWNEANK